MSGDSTSTNIAKVGNFIFKVHGNNIRFDPNGNYHIPDSSFLKVTEQKIEDNYQKFFSGINPNPLPEG